MGNLASNSVGRVFDGTAPLVDSITPITTGPTNADLVSFTVKFDESVQGFNAAADLVVSHTGTAHSGVSISGGPSTYSVDISGITGNGSFTLAVNTASDVEDLAGNALATSLTSAAVTIDNTPPGVIIGAPTGSPVNSSGTAVYPITVTAASSVNLTSGNVSINHSGTAGGSISILNGTTSTPSVEVTGVTGDGSYTINIAAGIASDAAANTSLSAGPGAAVTVDNTLPVLASLGVTPPLATLGQIVSIAFTASESLSANPFVSVNGHAAMYASNVGLNYSYLYTVQGTDPEGPATIVLSGVDLAGNAGGSSLGGGELIIDSTAPVFSNVVVDPAEASAGTLVAISFTSSEAITDDPIVTVNGNPATRTAKAAFAYEYTVLPTDPIGPATIEVSGLDLAGNAGMASSNVALVIVPNAPSVPLPAWPLGVLLAAVGAAMLGRRAR